MSRLVRKRLDEAPLRAASRRRLARLAARPEAAIDVSDIPRLSAGFWKNAVRNPLKQQLTVARAAARD